MICATSDNGVCGLWSSLLLESSVRPAFVYPQKIVPNSTIGEKDGVPCVSAPAVDGVLSLS